jgi:hypothetical protein
MGVAPRSLVSAGTRWKADARVDRKGAVWTALLAFAGGVAAVGLKSWVDYALEHRREHRAVQVAARLVYEELWVAASELSSDLFASEIPRPEALTDSAGLVWSCSSAFRDSNANSASASNADPGVPSTLPRTDPWKLDSPAGHICIIGCICGSPPVSLSIAGLASRVPSAN